jgi:hypothetical protein
MAGGIETHEVSSSTRPLTYAGVECVHTTRSLFIYCTAYTRVAETPSSGIAVLWERLPLWSCLLLDERAFSCDESWLSRCWAVQASKTSK